MINIKGKMATSNQGLMIGNGTIGSLLFGEDVLNISLDLIDLWDDRLPKEFSNPLFNYQNLSRLFKEDYGKAYELFDNCYLHPYPTKINAGKIVTNIKVSDDDLGEIDVYRAMAIHHGQDNSLSGYVDANKNVLVISFENEFDFKLVMPSYFYKKTNEGGLNYPLPNEYEIDGVHVFTQNMYKDRCFHILYFVVNNNMYLTITKSKDVSKSISLLKDYYYNHQTYYLKHVKTVRNYFLTASIKTPDDKINDLFNLGRYYFFCNSRKKYPVCLQGVWTDSRDSLPSWKNDIHNDLNLQMNYEAYLKLGNYKEGKVLLDYVINHLPQFKKNAKNFLNSDGIYIPGVMALKGYPLGGWPQYAMSLVTQIWLIKAFDEYYQHVQDDKCLKETIYPLFVEVEKGIRNNLSKNEKGFYQLDFHSSPEYFENDLKSLFEEQTNFELVLLKYLYNKLVEYSTYLDKEKSQYEEVLNNLADKYRNENDESKISINQEFDKSHRHFSHVLEYKNLRSVDPFMDNTLIKKDIDRIVSFGSDEWVGFSFTEIAGLYALVNNGNKAYENLKIFSNNFVHQNGFHMNNDYKEYKYSKMACYVFTLEANFGYLTALEDMMIKTYQNKLEIFPSLPDCFFNKKTSFKNLRLPGDHKITASTRKGNTTFKIKMNKEGTIVIKNNFASNPIINVDGNMIEYHKEIGEFITITAKKFVEYKREI